MAAQSDTAGARRTGALRARAGASWYAVTNYLRQRPLLGHLVAAALVCTATIVRQGVGPALPPGYPFLTFFPAVVFAALLAGWRAGALAAVLSGLVAWYLFIPPINSFQMDDRTLTALGFYAFVVGVEITLIGMLDRQNRRLRQEQAHNAALARSRELMFSELQHRVSNNLLVIASVLQMDLRRLADDEARAVLRRAADRLAIVGRIQRSLYSLHTESTSLAALSRDLAAAALEAAGRADAVVEVEGDAEVSADIVAPVALIVLECVNNAVEHALADRPGAVLRIRLSREPDAVQVLVQDDGPGLPKGFDLQRSGLGLKLARELAKQVGGQFTLTGDERGATAALRIAVR